MDVMLINYSLFISPYPSFPIPTKFCTHSAPHSALHMSDFLDPQTPIHIQHNFTPSSSVDNSGRRFVHCSSVADWLKGDDVDLFYPRCCPRSAVLSGDILLGCNDPVVILFRGGPHVKD